MGIVRLFGRDAGRLLTQAYARQGRRAWTEARGMGTWEAVVLALAMAGGKDDGARQIGPAQTCVCRDATQEQERGRTS